MSARCWLTRRASRRLCSRDSVLAWFRSGQVTRRPLLPGDLASIFFFLFLIWFSDIESGASNSSFWQSVLTSLEWFSKEQFLFGHWTLDGRFLFRGPKLLTPDLKLTNPRLSIWSKKKKSPPFSFFHTCALPPRSSWTCAHRHKQSAPLWKWRKWRRSHQTEKLELPGLCLDGSARVGVPASPNTVGHLVRLHRPDHCGQDGYKGFQLEGDKAMLRWRRKSRWGWGVSTCNRQVRCSSLCTSPFGIFCSPVGVDSCPSCVVLEESELLQFLSSQEKFCNFLPR